MIEPIITVESVEQVAELLAVGTDTSCVGEKTFGLRLPVPFTRDKQHEIVERTHEMNKQVLVAVNGIMHPEEIELIPEYLTFLEEVNVDKITLDDPGIMSIIQRDGLEIPYVCGGKTLITGSRQINFWNKRGAIGAVLAQKISSGGMVAIEENLAVPTEIPVYRAICTHQPKPPLIQNYYNYTKNDKGVARDEGLFISESRKSEARYSIYEDSHGTCILADDDMNLMNELTSLYGHHYHTWKLDDLYMPGENFAVIAHLFAEAKAIPEAGTWPEDQAAHATTEIEELHPAGRGLDNGFFDLSAGAIR